jgi:plasmid stabilization system protein ParE
MDSMAAYIAADNPTAALKVLDRIEQAGEKLGQMAIGRQDALPAPMKGP